MKKKKPFNQYCEWIKRRGKLTILLGNCPNTNLTGIRVRTYAGAYSLQLIFKGWNLNFSLSIRKPFWPVWEYTWYLSS